MNTVTSMEQFIKILNLEDDLVIVQYKRVARVLIRFMKRENMKDKIKEVLVVPELKKDKKTMLGIPCSDLTTGEPQDATYLIVKLHDDEHLEALDAVKKFGARNVLLIDYEVFASISQSENPRIDFMCCGFTKCGTTSLSNALRQNDRIALPKGKETFYMHWRNKYGNAPEVFIKKYFNNVDENKLHGNIEPSYHVSARDVYECFGPDVKIIFMVRQPSLATYSYFKMLMRRPRAKRYVNFYKKYRKYKLEIFSQYIEESIYTYGKDRFCYDRWIEQYLDYFPKEQIKVVVFEELIKEPTRILDEIQEFIGVKNPITYTELPFSNEGSAVSRNYISAYINYRYYMAIRSRKESLSKDLTFKQRKFFEFAKWAQKYTTVENNEKMTPEQRKGLDDFYRPCVENLEKIIGRPLKDVWGM